MIRKYNIKYREKKKGFNKWVRNKKIIAFFFLISVICLCNLFNNIDNAKAVDSDENYSQYLTNNAITINDDKAMLLKTVASSGTNYRTLFENNFLFPAKLSTEALNLAGNEYASYSACQTYLDNLDSSYNYKSNDISENIAQNITISNNDLVLNNGTYNGYYNENSKYIVPNADISTQWKRNPLSPTTHYSAINTYPSSDTYDYIFVDNTKSLSVDTFDLSTITIADYVFQIDIIFYYYIQNSFSNDFKVSLYNGTDWTEETIVSGFSSYSYNWKTVSITNLHYNQNEIDNLQIRLRCPTTISEYGLLSILSLGLVLKDGLCLGNNDFQVINSESCLNSTQNSLYNYKGTYSFTNDNENSIPQYWANYYAGYSRVRKDTHYLHTNTLQTVRNSTYSSSGSYTDFANLQKSFIEWYWITDTISGSGGSWIAITDKTGSITMGTDLYFHNYGGYGNGIYYWDNVGLKFVCSATINTWYKIRVDFDTLRDKFNITVNSVKYINEANFRVNCDNINRVVCAYEWSNGKSRVDAIGINSYNYTSNAFTTFEQISTYIQKTDFSFERNIDYYNDNDYKPIFYDFYFSLTTNITNCNYNFSVYNYDLLKYVKIYNSVPKFTLNQFRFNESAYFRFNKFKIKFFSNYSSSFATYLFKLELNITYIKENLNGNQYVVIRFNEKDLSNNFLGYYQLEVKIRNDSIDYRYLEVSSGDVDYDYGWLSYDLEENGISLTTLEILGQIRYGFNTLVQEITNVKFTILLNNNEKNISLLEQNRRGSFAGHKYNIEFNYTANNRNYLNLTGIYGNYSYCSLAGIRCLKGAENEIYNRFFTIPTFWERISVATLGVTSGSTTIENEPPAPAGAGNYWTYTSYRLVDGDIINTDVGNWSIEFRQTQVEQYTAKFYYYPKIIKESSWGSWTFKINDDWRISFNFIRDAIVGFLNLLLTFLQYMLYLLTAGLSFILMFIGCYILFFVWNYLFYYIYIGLIWVVWWLWVLLLWLWSVIVWIWANIIIPFAEWCYYNLLPAIMEALIIICAFLITCLLYLMTLGRIDFWETYYQVKDMLNLIVDMILEVVDVFVYNIGDILLFVIYYIALVLMLYAKYLYVKSRGYINRADSLNASFEVYIAPFMLVYNVLKRVWESVPES